MVQLNGAGHKCVEFTLLIIANKNNTIYSNADTYFSVTLNIGGDMGQLSGTLDILYVEDDGEDFSLFLDAVRENGFLFNIQRINDGQELVGFFQE